MRRATSSGGRVMSTAAAGPDPALVEAIARRVVELLRDDWRLAAESRYVDAATLAEDLKVERDWVYAHARQLGAIRLGDGPRARLRFDPEVVAERLAGADARSWRPPRRTPRRSASRRDGTLHTSASRPDADRVDSKKVRRRAGVRAPASSPKRQQPGGNPE